MILYSYWYYRKQCKKGITVSSSIHNRYKRISSIVGVVIATAVVVLLCTGNISYEIGEESFEIKASYWPDMTVNYDQITNIEYREADDVGQRVGGFGSFRLLMGSFENEEFKFYTRYSYEGCDSCIVIEIKNSILVISGKDEQTTKNVYEMLSSKINAIY